MITRYCFIDYDREIGIVLEMTENGREKLIGVGRLIIDTGHNTAQFVAAVGDPWQGRGAGSLLIDYCIKIARYRGIRRIGTKMLPDNEVAIKTLKKRGFVLEEDGDIIRGTLTVEGEYDGFDFP
jgi:acetyltransferase